MLLASALSTATNASSTVRPHQLTENTSAHNRGAQPREGCLPPRTSGTPALLLNARSYQLTECMHYSIECILCIRWDPTRECSSPPRTPGTPASATCGRPWALAGRSASFHARRTYAHLYARKPEFTRAAPYKHCCSICSSMRVTTGGRPWALTGHSAWRPIHSAPLTARSHLPCNAHPYCQALLASLAGAILVTRATHLCAIPIHC